MRQPDESSPHIQKATLVIRSSGERTEGLCRKLILDQGVRGENLHIVRERPFSASMRRSFEIGLENGLPWTFCVDADLLLRPGSVETMVKYAEKKGKNVCEIQGYIVDKFFGGPRKGGVHLYRTSLLPKVIEQIPEEGRDIRPERHTLGKMEENGYPWKTVPYIVGTHDEEQYNYDIYRKAFVQAVKHTRRAELFITLWRERRKDDPDFEVALKGFADSVENSREIFIDHRQPLYKKMFEEAGFPEKPELDIENYSPDWVENQIREWSCSDIYYRYFPTRDGLDRGIATGAHFGVRKLKESIGRRGVVGTARLALGTVFTRTGKKLRRG